MDFTKDIVDFPSEVHKVIYSGAREMTTPDRSLAGMTDAAMRASCEAYYAFLTALYSDMYEHPEAYHMPVRALETFLDGRKLNGVKQKYPSKTKALIALTRNCAERYLQTLCRMAYLGTLDGDRLTLASADLAAIDKAVNTSTSPVSLKQRLAAMARVGLLSEDAQAGARRFYCEHHPNLFPAMIALAQRTKGTCSGMHFYLFTKAEFRNIPRAYKPTAEDYIAPLPGARRDVAAALHTLALSLGCRTDISTFLKINYKYKGAEVLLMDTKDGVLNVRVTEVYAWDDRAFFMERLLAQPEALRRCADRHLWRCTACSTSHVGQKIEFLGRHNRVCGGGLLGFVWQNPGMDELDDIAFFIQTRRDMLDVMKRA